MKNKSSRRSSEAKGLKGLALMKIYRPTDPSRAHGDRLPTQRRLKLTSYKFLPRPHKFLSPSFPHFYILLPLL